MIRHRLIQLTAPLAAASLLFFALFVFFSSFGSTEVAANGPFYGVEIESIDADQEVDRGDTVAYTYWVTNTGDSADTYTIAAANELGWPTTVSSPTLSIAPNISDTVVLTINVDSKAVAGSAITTITATSNSWITATDFATNNTSVKPEYGVAISPGAAKSGLPNEIVTYSHIVTNTGNGPDTFTINTVPTNPDFEVEPTDQDIDIGAYLTGTIVISVTVPGDALITESTFVNITATSDHPGVDPAAAQDTTNVKRIVAVALAKNENSSAKPGETVEYEHTVKNNGNGIDTFSFTAVSNHLYPTTVPGPIQLDPNESRNIIITVKIPLGTSAGIIDETTVTATSLADSSEDASVIDTTTVAEHLDVEIEGNETGSADPGTTAVYTHTVTNQGNSRAKFNIGASSDKAFVTRVSPASLTLDRGTSGLVRVEIDIPANATLGTVDKTTVTAVSDKNASVKDTVVDTTTIGHVFGVEIATNESSTANPGDTVVYTHTVTNKGNGSDTFNITAASDHGFVTRVTPSSLPLNKGGSGLVRVEIDISRSLSVGPNEKDKTTVTATSKGSAAVNANVTDTTNINKHRSLLPLVNSVPVWEQVGLDSWVGIDEARSMDVCSTDSDLIFAGTEDSLRLFDGNSWTTLNFNVPEDGLVNSIVMNKSCDAVYVVIYKRSVDALVDAHGVWEGALDNQGNWTWQELTGGVDVSLARKVVISDGTLFAGGGFGIAHWKNGVWTATNIVSGSGKPIMDLSVADGVNNSGPVYAVQWLSTKVYHNTNPGGSTGNWSEISGIADVPDKGWVRSVAGDDSNVGYVGTRTNLYRLNGTNWELVKNQESLSVLVSGNVYAGFAGAPGDGVFISTDQGANFLPYNEGWNVPAIVYVLVENPKNLFAATSSGVFRR